MSENSSAKPLGRRIWHAIGLVLWVLASFVLAQLIVGLVLLTGVSDRIGILADETLLQLISAVLIYSLTFVIVIFGSRLIGRRHETSREELGLTRLPSWGDIGLAPAAFIIYAIIYALVAMALTELVPGFNLAEEQDVGFTNLYARHEYLLAFAALVVVAPIAEEVLFRGYLYGKLRGHLPVVAAAVIVSVFFGAIHGQWNVAVDTFILSMVMCTLREITGSIWAGTLLHMLKNGIAFFVLFIYPNLAL